MSNNAQNALNEKQLTDLLSFGEQINSNKVRRVALSQALETIRTGNGGLKEHTEQIRSSAPDERPALKEALPYITMAVFKGDVRKNVNLESIQYLLLDVDKLGHDKAAELKELLKQDQEVFLVCLSPSASGLKVAYRLRDCISDPALYSTVYKQFSKQFSDRYAVELDHTSDAARACFVPYDPELYVNPDALEIDAKHFLSEPERAVAKKRKGTGNGNDQLAELLAVSGLGEGERTPHMSKMIGHCIRRNMSEQLALELVRGWNQKNNPPHPDEKIVYTVHDEYTRYKTNDDDMPYQIFERNGAYFKSTFKSIGQSESMIAAFTMEPIDLLEFEDGDCMRAKVKTSRGREHDEVRIENTDWHSKAKFLRALIHSDCTFHGSDLDVQALCNYIMARVPIRRKGTRVIGLLSNHDRATWVTEGLNITEDSISFDPTIISYDKGASAFYKNIQYGDIPDSDYQALVSGLYADILGINESSVIIPWLAWTLAAPVKPLLMEHIGGFPLAFVHGPQGCGKTSTARLIKRLSGYRDPKPHSCRQNWFPMLKLLSSTNAIPVLLDEFKVSLLSARDTDNLIAFMNKAYSGEIEPKGREDQTTKDYVISAPMGVMGEWNISVPSVHERILVVRFKESAKKDRSLQAAFGRISELHLEAFMPRYIQFCLRQDIAAMFDDAKRLVEATFKSIPVAPRITNNLAVMVLGVELFRRFGVASNVGVPDVDVQELLRNQLKEITGSNRGFVMSAVDQLFNEFSVMAMKEKPQVEKIVRDASGNAMPVKHDPNGYDVKIRKDQDYKVLSSLKDDSGRVVKHVLAINFTKIFPDFKQYAKQTAYEGDLLDYQSYAGLFDECSYVVKKNHPVKFNGKTIRAVCIDIKKAEEAGVNLEGFDLTI
jgi:hypothetical protein